MLSFHNAPTHVNVATMARISLGGGPVCVSQSSPFFKRLKKGQRTFWHLSVSLAILGHADGHPTFLVLFDAHTVPRLLDTLDLLLVQHQLARAQALGADQIAAR
jgi:hypothetical protein